MNSQKALKVSYRFKECQGNSRYKHFVQCQPLTKQKLSLPPSGVPGLPCIPAPALR